MNSFDQVSQQCRHLKLASLVQDLPELLQQAEANEISYLQYTEVLLGHEVKQRNSKRIAMNRRKAGFPMENIWKPLIIVTRPPSTNARLINYWTLILLITVIT